MTIADVTRALEDERHQGFGLATARHLDDATRDRLFECVAAVAADMDLDAETFFHWANAKSARWLVDDASGGYVDRDLVRRYLNPAELERVA